MNHCISAPYSPNASRLKAGAAACLMLPALLASAQTLPSNLPYTVTDRGNDYRVWQRTVSSTDPVTGQATQQVQAYREVGNGICYQAPNGAWVDSQDLIELTATGAQAVHGPMAATFNSDNTSVGAVTLTTPSGDVFQSHVIGLFYADSASGKVVPERPEQFEHYGLWREGQHCRGACHSYLRLYSHQPYSIPTVVCRNYGSGSRWLGLRSCVSSSLRLSRPVRKICRLRPQLCQWLQRC
jgi:hypothetical protein